MQHRICVCLTAAGTLLMACRSPHVGTSLSQKSFADYQQKAGEFGSVLKLPDYETTPEAVRGSMSNAIAIANAALDKTGGLKSNEVTFRNTIQALDDISYQAASTANRIYLLKETSENAALRDAGTQMIKAYEEWTVGLDYREDVYAAVRAFAETKPKLEGEDRKLFEEILRDYKRAGLHLAKAQRDEVERLRKELTGLTTDFDANITKVQKPMIFTREDLEGVPEDFLNQPKIKTDENQYTVMANVTFHFVTVMENAKREATRKRLKTARYQLAQEQNVSLLQKIVELRDEIATRLGYASWADFQTEIKMAKTGRRALEFVEQLSTALQPKFDQELNEYRALKVKETGDPNAKIHLWDWRYYSNQLKKEKYTVDSEQLRVYFPYQRVLDGMFATYERIFRLKISPLDAPYKWTETLKLYMVQDSKTGEPLGLFYLDMFPREGKYNHFAQFGIIEGKLLPDGKYQRPTVALICNFPPPQNDRPSLLSHQEVETLFHEFGHAMHSLLTRAKFARFSGTSVPRDFVEAPSQMLENWVWDKKVLDSFAADYRDPSKKIPQEIIAKLKEAKLATVGTFYRRQLSMAILDLTLHSKVKSGGKQDTVRLSNEILSKHFLPVPEGTAFVAYFGHLTGYDAGYYGYAWADAIAADMATAFEKSPRGYDDTSIGMRLRNEIYAPGGSRDVEVSIQRFLGRPQSIDAFLKTLGMGPTGGAPLVK
jgi:thimet oligopeptidase